MSDLASLVSQDSRPLVERLRRCKLWALADSLDIQYPVGSPKTDMLKILDANGVNLNQPVPVNGVQWHTMHGKNSEGAPCDEVYPVAQPHLTSGKDIDYEGEMARKISAKPAEDELFEESRVQALERELASLKQRAPQLDFPLDKLLPWQLNHMCKDRDVDPAGMDKNQMIAAIGGGNGQDTTERSQ